jgi:hypothetical protein
MAASRPPLQLVHGETAQTRPTRVLLGWLTEQEAPQLLFGRASASEEEAQKATERLTAARQNVQMRPACVPGDPVVATRTADTQARLDAVGKRPDVQAVFGGMNWRPELVDLRKVFSFQKLVNTESLDERIAAGASVDGLFELCFPSSANLPPQAVLTDADGKGFTVSALNPNLRHAGSHVSQAMVSQGPGMPPVPMQAISLFVNMGSSFLQVVRYKDRCFVRDGYHRASGLLKRGIYEVPSIFIEARTFDDVGCPPGSLTYEILYGERPPTLSDFWDDTVSRDGQQIAVRKVVRVTVEEFIVPR